MKFLQSRFFVLALSFCCFLLTNCDRDKPIDGENETLPVTYKRMVNEVIAAHPMEADGLNLPLTTNALSFAAIFHIFQTLQSIDPETIELIPVLAKASPLKEERGDNLAYTFEIREEAVWPNGTPVTSKDVAFSMKATLNPKVPASAHRANMSPIADLILDEANPRKFTIVMKGKGIRHEEVASNSFAILPQYHYDAQNFLTDIDLKTLLDPAQAEQLADTNPNLQAFADEFMKPKYAREADGVVGSGPYQLKSWVTGQNLTLEKKENWWGEKIANPNFAFDNKVDEIIYQEVKDPAAKEAAIRNEQIDVLTGIAPDLYKKLKQDETINEAYDFFEATRFAHGFWYINSDNPKLEDKKVRRALAHLVDVNTVIETVLDMDLRRITTPVLPDMPGHDTSLKPIEFDIEKAKKLLAEAGWEDTNDDGTVDKLIDGERVEMKLEVLISAGRTTQINQIELVKSDALKAGVEITAAPKEFNVIGQELGQRNYELALGATGEATPWAYDPHESWHTTNDIPSGRNRVGFGNAETDALIDKIRATLDQEERNELYKAFQQIIYEEQPMIFLYEVPNFLAIHKRFNAEALPYRPNYFPGAFDMNKK